MFEKSTIMKDSDWIIIFKLKEFNSCLTSNELIQLSLGCKMFRECLIRYIYVKFDFTLYANFGNYNSCIVSRGEYKKGSTMVYVSNPFKSLGRVLTKNKARFKLELENFHYKPRKLVVYNAEYYYYLLYDIPSVFSKLTTIIISYSNFLYEQLQYLLDNIKCLENLELSNSNLIQDAQSPDITPINWPNSLKKLKICNNLVARIDDIQKSILIINNYIISSSTSQLYFSLKHLSKLLSFEYQLFSEQFDDENLWEFLKLNSQIKNLIIRVPDFHPKLFEAIQCIDSISSLHLEFMKYHNYGVNYNNLPIISNISSLTITLYDKPDINDIIIDKFINLTELTVQIYSKDFDKLINLSKKLSIVKSLSLNISIENSNVKKFRFPWLDNLKELNFILYSDIYLTDIDWDINSCPNLKVVKFSKVKGTVYFEQPKFNPGLFDCWKVVYFPHKTTFFKVGHHS
jgi:hypothetical protein